MTARTKTKAKAEATTLGAALARAVNPTVAEEAKQLRAQCLALACSQATDNDNTEQVIRDAQAFYDWIKSGAVPRKPELRAVP